MGNFMRLQNQFAGPQMPPNVRISHIAAGHGKQSQAEDDDK